MGGHIGLACLDDFMPFHFLRAQHACVTSEKKAAAQTLDIGIFQLSANLKLGIIGAPATPDGNFWRAASTTYQPTTSRYRKASTRPTSSNSYQ